MHLALPPRASRVAVPALAIGVLLAFAPLASAQRTGTQRTSVQRTTATAPPAWPAITSEMRPWTRWWGHGSAVNPADLSANLQAYRRVGLGGGASTAIS